MSLYSKCPSCSSDRLGQVQKDYEVKLEQIRNNVKLTTEQKDEAMQKLAKSYGLKYCCNMRLISYVQLENTAKMSNKL